MKRILAALVLPFAVSVASGCAPFSSYETARSLAPGQPSLGAAVTGVTHYRGVASPGAEPGFDGDAIGVEAFGRFGMTTWLETSFKLSQAWGRDALDGSLKAGQLGGKVQLIPEELALLFALGGTNLTAEAHVLPGAVWTVTMSRTLELDLAGRMLIFGELDDLGKVSSVVNAGVRWRSDAHRFELHPELSLLVDDLGNDKIAFGDSLAVALGVAVVFTP